MEIAQAQRDILQALIPDSPLGQRQMGRRQVDSGETHARVSTAQVSKVESLAEAEFQHVLG